MKCQPNKPKKRLSSSVFLNKYLQFLKPNGKIHIKTDSRLLYEYSLALAQHNHLQIHYNCTDVYSDFNIPESVRNIQTFYEEKFIKSDKKINYLQLTLNNEEALSEPDDWEKFKISNYKDIADR